MGVMNGLHRFTSGLDTLGSTLLFAAALALSATWLVLLAAGLTAVLGIDGTSALLGAARPLAVAFGICAVGAFLAMGGLRVAAREQAPAAGD